MAKQTGKPFILNARGNFNPVILSLPYLAKVYRNAYQIITHSPQNYKKLKDKISIELIHHPVESNFFNYTQKNYNLPIELISVCRLLKLKHLDWVLNALKQLKEQNYQFRYHVIGDGSELENLKQITRQNNLNSNVIFHGYKNHSEINDLLQKSHIFIMPSYPETLGRSFLEAAAANYLVIGHKNTGVDGLFKHKKSAVFVVKETLLTELKLVFENFSHSYLQTYTENARKIVNDLTWEKIGKTYYKLYNTNTVIIKKSLLSGKTGI